MDFECKRWNSFRVSEAAIRRVSWLTLLGATCALTGCAAPDSSEETGETQQAVRKANQPLTTSESPGSLADSCGYEVKSMYHSRWRRDGFLGLIELKNVSGERATDFEVFADLNGAKPSKCLLSDCEAVEGGYLFTPPKWFKLLKLGQGQSYPILYMSRDAYTDVTPYVISVNGVVCDQVAPMVSLDASGSFYTAAGTLTLTATATDNVAVKKVVFLRDGQVIGTDMTAPYTLQVPISASENGRHRYAATAYDMSGNSASSASRSVLTGIGNKFFGTAATTPADYTNLLAHFNQITPGNAGKWGSVEAVQDQMNFAELDTAYSFAKANNLPFKLHTLVWGQQQPAWIDTLPPEQQLAEIEQWMAALAQRYPDIEMIDVVNEPLHAPPSYAGALGGSGATGWDWVIKSFEMARAHFPNAELILNDYSILTMSSSTQSYLAVINLLKERGLIDGIGEQGHFYERAPEMSVLTGNLQALAATGLPIYISELDVDFADDARQANRMKELFEVFWSTPSVLGVTHWGYLQGNTWRTNAFLVKTDGTLRPALTWIECYKAGGTNCTVPEYVPRPRVGDLNGITLEAEDYDAAQSLIPAGDMVAYASNGSWLSFSRVTFDSNWDSLKVTYAQGGSSSINLSIHLGSLDNAPVATVVLPSTGGWNTKQTVTVPWAPINGTQDVFVRFNGGGANVDKLQYAAPTGNGMNLVTDSDFESGTTGGWWSWGGGAIANTTVRAVSGTHGLAMTARNGNSPLVQSLTSTVLPGKTYKVSLWATLGGSASSAYVTTVTKCTGGSDNYGRLGGWGNTKDLTDGTWVEFTGDLVVPDCPLANVGMWLEGPGAGVDLYIDHVSVRQQTASNVINNGTFESGVAGWYTWSGGTLSATTARAHGGTQSLLVTNRASNAPAATDLTSVVKSGTSYPYSLYVSIQSPDASSKSINVTQATECRNADGTVSPSYNWIGSTTVPSGTSWTQLSGTVAVPNCDLARLQIYVEGGAGADLYVDDVTVTDNGGAPVNLIPDGTFESGQGGWFGWGATISVETSSAHSGTASLRGASMASGAIARDISSFVAPGKRYTASAWVTVGNLAAGSGSVRWQTVQACNGAADSYPWLAGATVSNGVWQKIAGTVDLSACTSIEKLLLFTGADTGDVYIDDVELIALP